ncbi:MAG: AMP-binding protein [Pseudomonadota bacterium]
MTERLLHERLFAAADWRGEAPALAAPDATLSHAGLAQAVRRAAGLLERRGVRPGDRVVWLGFNAAAQIVLTFAAARLGAMTAPLNWRLAEEELAWIFGDAEPRLVFADAAHADAARRVAGGVEVLPAEALLEGDGEATGPEPAPQDPALLVYTSGASGRPKGALLSHRAVAANATLATDMHALTKADHVHTVLPMFHVGGLNIQTVPALLAGARVTLMDRFEPGACLAQIAAERPTLSVHVPATFAALTAHPGWAAADLSSLRLIATGSTDVPAPMIEAIHARGVPVVQIYGATETAPVVVYQREADAVARLGSIGRPGPKVEIRLTDPEGRDVPDGTEGEIRVKSPTLASGYWRRPDSAGEFDGGWWRSGDVARRDAEGWLWFADRVKNVIVSGGENIYPAELERVLAGLPGVREAAVVGRPDPRWGAVPVAVVAAEGLSEADVLGAFDGRLARFKRPKAVVFVEALPRNAVGKVLSPEVRALAA